MVRPQYWPRRLLRLATLFAVVPLSLAPHRIEAGGVLFVVKDVNIVGEYDAATGATINANFISLPKGLSHSLAVDGNNHLFVSNGTNTAGTGTVGEYNAITGAAISVPFLTASQGLSDPNDLAVDASSHLMVLNRHGLTVGQYDATTSATINPALVNDNQGLNDPIFLALDKVNNHLFVDDDITGTVSEFNTTTGATIKFHFADLGFSGAYQLLADNHNHLFVNGARTFVGIEELDAITGAVINPTFIPGPVYGMTLDDNNHLLVDNGSAIGQYDATTGAAINANLITGLSNANSIAFVSVVPEPATLVLMALAAVVIAVVRARVNGALITSNPAAHSK